MRSLEPGTLRCELSLQQCARTGDELGGHTESWSEVAKLFGAVEPVSARAMFGAGQSLEDVTHRITVRHRDDLTSGMRFSWQARTFEILTVHDPDETGRYLVCRTREEGL